MGKAGLGKSRWGGDANVEICIYVKGGGAGKKAKQKRKKDDLHKKKRKQKKLGQI